MNTIIFNRVSVAYIYRFITLVACLLASNVTLAQQTYSYAQYMNNLLPLNPAYSSLSSNTSFNLTSRKEWTGVDGSPSTVIFSNSIPLKNINSSTGIVADYDKLGVESTSRVNLYFAKSIKISKSFYLSTALNAGFKNYRMGLGTLSPSDPSFRSDISQSGFNFGLSVLLYSPQKYYLGVSLPQVTNSSTNQYNDNPVYYSAAYLLPLDQDVALKGAALYSYHSVIPSQTDLSVTLYLKNRIGIGASYNTNSTIGGILTYFINNNLSLGYSYQTTTGSQNAGSAFGGTHEISLAFNLGDKLLPKLL